MRKKTRFAAYAKKKAQISAYVIATWTVQYLCFYPKFQASSHFQWMYSLVCVRPGQNPQRLFSHVEALILTPNKEYLNREKKTTEK